VSTRFVHLSPPEQALSAPSRAPAALVKAIPSSATSPGSTRKSRGEIGRAVFVAFRL
jgi:hypothetical protein